MTEDIERDYDDEFLLTAENGHIYFKIENAFGFPNTTCAWGGYDTKSSIEIKASNYYVKGQVYISTGELYEFYIKLKECYEKLTGEANLESYEKNLKLKVIFDGLGHAKVQGTFKEYHHINNVLTFELLTDQTYLFQAGEQVLPIFMTSTVTTKGRSKRKTADNIKIKRNKKKKGFER